MSATRALSGADRSTTRSAASSSRSTSAVAARRRSSSRRSAAEAARSPEPCSAITGTIFCAAVADQFDLTGKVALVTGGSRGLGREMVLAFAQAGADVVIASRKLDNCARVAAEVEATTGRAALAHGVHVGRWDQLPGLVDAAYERFGRLDVLVNNAGMSPVYPSLADVSEKLFDSVVNVNL